MAEELINIVEENNLLVSKVLASRTNQRSELSQEIISRKPDFIERWALIIFLTLLLLMLAATWFIKYPDIIETTAILIPENATEEIIPRQDGHLVRLFIHNNEQVKPNEVIGWLESTASHEDVLALSKQLDSSIILFSSGHKEKMDKLFSLSYVNLGEVQISYQQFIISWQQFNYYRINKPKDDLSQQKIIFQQAMQSLKSQLDDWKKKYILQSPVAGKVSFIIPLREGQYLKAGRLLGYINPDDNHFYVEATLPQNNFGKIEIGQKVQLRFIAYPYQETGVVEGTLNYVSNVTSDSEFLATISLDKGLVTNMHKSIPYKNGLQAQAIIITKNMRLAERLYYNIIKSTSTGSK